MDSLGDVCHVCGFDSLIILDEFSSMPRVTSDCFPCPRLAYATTVRNVFENYSGFDMLKNWEVFHRGAASEILKKCGNPHLSPFRTYGSKREFAKHFDLEK